jgi:hypothetical protein
MNRRQAISSVSAAAAAALIGCGHSPDSGSISATGQPPSTPRGTTGGEKTFKAMFGKLPSAQRPLNPDEVATEGQVLAILLIALHQQNFDALSTNATPSGDFTGANATVYGQMNSYIKADSARTTQIHTLLKSFREVVADATSTALGAQADVYDDDPNACLSAGTISKIGSALNKA